MITTQISIKIAMLLFIPIIMKRVVFQNIFRIISQLNFKSNKLLLKQLKGFNNCTHIQSIILTQKFKILSFKNHNQVNKLIQLLLILELLLQIQILQIQSMQKNKKIQHFNRFNFILPLIEFLKTRLIVDQIYLTQVKLYQKYILILVWVFFKTFRQILLFQKKTKYQTNY
ncbi:transmembrane protein, putative (macronuclear) [Tetrahymena thermophila SB210]|uniref:Transmembrane protein, putative n=1 Tax=Tetrahymena thermophila (strain SB210) TaxID=312017 RepID=W7XH14_TETTS|nr:transmembrane protein, putative [Tetrahymena thermophila SB210]EWS76398.1 transmembrane protein, putative [Tetrahymena thermophila SB210]|eukprot:XP_012651182.1 transmembrane protein, putative [Tetrahymena thermophila SB210]